MRIITIFSVLTFMLGAVTVRAQDTAVHQTDRRSG